MGALFSGPPSPPKPPPPVEMPDLQNPALLLEAQRRARGNAQSGRDSTILSGGSDSYSGSKLGTP